MYGNNRNVPGGGKPMADRKREYDRNSRIGRAMNPNPEHHRDYEPPLWRLREVEWCPESMRWRSKRTRRYVNPHCIPD